MPHDHNTILVVLCVLGGLALLSRHALRHAPMLEPDLSRLDLLDQTPPANREDPTPTSILDQEARQPCPPLVTEGDLLLLAHVIGLLERTNPDTWWAGPTYRSPDGTRHCALAHVETAWGIATMERFEDRWATSNVLGAVNDGNDDGYPQDTAKERCLAYLSDLWIGEKPSTQESMEMQYRWGEGMALPSTDMLAHVRTHPADLQRTTR